MSKITFRADDDLVRRLEEFDASKSEVMREALRSYLDGEATSDAGTVDDALVDRVDQLIAERLDARFEGRARDTQDVNVNVTLEGVRASETAPSTPEAAGEPGREAPVDARGTDVNTRKTPAPDASGTDENDEGGSQTDRKTCAQCGENMGSGHVYCPNCGEKASHRVFCDCGDELRTDWAFCPSCGRRTPAADVLDRP
ncbi:MAG: zinc ribbon domain-containing protein [Haloferacaceae archaeon]